MQGLFFLAYCRFAQVFDMMLDSMLGNNHNSPISDSLLKFATPMSGQIWCIPLFLIFCFVLFLMLCDATWCCVVLRGAAWCRVVMDGVAWCCVLLRVAAWCVVCVIACCVMVHLLFFKIYFCILIILDYSYIFLQCNRLLIWQIKPMTLIPQPIKQSFESYNILFLKLWVLFLQKIDRGRECYLPLIWSKQNFWGHYFLPIFHPLLWKSLISLISFFPFVSLLSIFIVKLFLACVEEKEG